MNWFDSKACASRQFCRSCRVDQAWRKTLLTAGKVQELDFPCPHGITSDRLPAEGLGDLVGKIATPIARALGLPCIDPRTRDLRAGSKCAERKAWMNGGKR